MDVSVSRRCVETCNCVWRPDAAGGYTSRQILDIVFILRVLRLIRVVDSIKRLV